MRETRKTNRGYIAIVVELFARARQRDEEEHHPGNANLSPELEVHRTETRVEARAHPEVVHEVAGHADLLVPQNRPEVHDNGHAETVDDCDGHELAKVLNDRGEVENVGKVENTGECDAEVEALVGVAVVHEGFVAERRNREAFLLESRDDPCDEELEEEVRRVDFNGPRGWARVLHATSRQN